MWDRISPEDCEALVGVLNDDPNENAVHRFLEGHSAFLVQALATGHGRYQCSKPRFGSGVCS